MTEDLTKHTTDGVPWDFQRVRVAEQELNEGKEFTPIGMGTLVGIYNAGNKVPYTHDARNMFAKNALIAVSKMTEGDKLDEVLEKIVEETNERFQGKH